MNFKTAPFLFLLLILVSSTAQEQDLNAEDKPPLNEAWTYKAEDGLTLPNCIEFQWQAAAKGKLPTSIKFKNPFLEPLWVSARVHGSPCALFEIEYYDSYLKEWRRPVPIPGSTGEKGVSLKSGESVILPIGEGYWDFILETIPRFKLEEVIRFRLVFDLAEGISIRSSEFQWNQANKSVLINRLDAQSSND